MSWTYFKSLSQCFLFIVIINKLLPNNFDKVRKLNISPESEHIALTIPEFTVHIHLLFVNLDLLFYFLNFIICRILPHGPIISPGKSLFNSMQPSYLPNDIAKFLLLDRPFSVVKHLEDFLHHLSLIRLRQDLKKKKIVFLFNYF